MRRSYFVLLLLICCSLSCMMGCSSKNDAPSPEQGIIFNPIKPYQESLPGQIITFKFKVTSRDSITGFGLRFKFPGAADFVSLPEYPDLTSTAKAFTSKYQVFEYAIPGSAIAVNTATTIKFVATTATQSYEKDYTIKMLSLGLQRARLYSAASSSPFKFSNIDLLRAVATPAPAPTLVQDMIPVYQAVRNTVSGVTSSAIVGWTSGNGTKFKIATAANYNTAATQYATVYAGIGGTGELTQVNTINSVTPLAANQYYIAKVNRNNVLSYVGILVKKSPTVIATTANGPVTFDPLTEYIELEIKTK